MSFSKCRIRIQPERALRRWLLVAAVAAALAGALLLLRLPLTGLARSLLVTLWLVSSVCEFVGRIGVAARIDALEIAVDGTVTAIDRCGTRSRLSLLPGSVVGSRLAFLRLGFADGRQYGEMLRGCPRDGDWRRLQIFWEQHRGSRLD